MKQIAYEYKNLPIPGGGYVTGFLFHPRKENRLYIRTDIGGTYCFDYAAGQWKSVTESVNMSDLSETYPIALAVDQKKPERLLIASGVNSREEGAATGTLSISEDCGKTFVRKPLPCFVHGNLNGRGTGLRLITDPAAENGLYFASQKEGLFYSPDLGDTWKRLETGGEDCMTCVWASPCGQTIIAGTAGVTTGTREMRGHSLYVSYDKGKSFVPMIMPENIMIEGSKWSGYVAHRYEYDGTYFYVTLVNTGARSYVTEMGYSCDSGDSLGGRILRYEFDENGKIAGYQDITPTCLWGEKGAFTAVKESVYPFGFGGVSSCPLMPGLLAASTICKDDGDMVFISKDYGESWEAALYDLSLGNMHFESAYMRPEFNGGHNLIHWLSDIKINPFQPDEVWFNSGTGVFRSSNFTRDDRSFCDCCKGIEETVHLNVYSPVGGPVKAIDIVGDLGGFAFTDLDTPCENSFADGEGNRYITCINADFSDEKPQVLAVTPRGNWKGKTKGGLILSKDYGLTFERLPLPYGISDYLDERFRQIECPNVNAGWISLSSDAESMVYCVAEGIDLFMKGVIVSNNQGKRFCKAKIFDGNGRDISDSGRHMKVFSDRVNPDVFYGFGDDYTVYTSADKGNTFTQTKVSGLPEGKTVFGLIDCANKTEIRGEAGKEGVFYMAVGEYGLYKLHMNPKEKTGSAERLSKDKEAVFRVGLGLLREQGDYRKENKALYICGVIEGSYGFFRSFDDGATWEKINDETQQFGNINSIDGDCRRFGRYFIATGSFGVKYGEPVL